MTQELMPYGLTDEEYEQASASATKAYEKMKDSLSSAVKKITDDIHEKVHDTIIDYLEQDTQYNFSELVRTRVNRILQGMLSGGWSEAEARKWLEGYDFEKYRKEIYIANTDIIQNKLIDDLRLENANLKERLEWARAR